MNIFLHELKANTRSIITWSVTLIAILFALMAFFPNFAEQAEAMNQLLANFPPEVLRVFGMDGLDFTQPLGFFGMIFLFCQICIAIQAANYGVSLISIEERDLTADFLLAKPVSRIRILTTKLLAALVSLLITNAVGCIASLGALSLFWKEQPGDTRTVFLLLSTLLFLQLFFLTVGLAVSLLLKKVRSVTPISLGLVFGFYALNAFKGTMENDPIRFFSPFSHFEATSIIRDGAIDVTLMLISVAVIIIAAAASYTMYQRRNIHSV